MSEKGKNSGKSSKEHPKTHVSSEIEFSRDFELREEAVADLIKRLEESSVDTRDALLNFSPVADEFQTKVIEAKENTIRVIAPAGSGKTQTVANRALFRIREGLNPKRILIVTFDNAAASSIASKLNEQIDKLDTQIDRPTVSTLNSYGYGILREHVDDEFRPVVQDYRQRRIIREVLKQLKEKSVLRYEALPRELLDSFYIELFSRLKNEAIDPRSFDHQLFADYILGSDQAAALIADPKDRNNIDLVIQSLIWMYQTYDQGLVHHQVLDFDDQKLRAFIALRDKQSLREIIQGRYSEIVVDEFQDINKLDFLLVMIISQKATLLVTGDDDQAIYGFRGCSPEYILNLQEHVGSDRPVASYELRTNYRCPPNIVYHADQLIRNNTHRLVKNPVAASKAAADIKVVSSKSSGLEARWIVKFIERVRRANKSLPYNEFAVLYRTNAQNLPIQVEFILNNIPYHVRKQDNILENRVLHRLLGVLRLKLAFEQQKSPDPSDSVLTVRAYFRYMSGEQERAVRPLFEQEGDFFKVIGSSGFHAILPKSQNSQLAVAVSEMHEATSLMNTLDVLARRFKGLRGMIGSLEDVAMNKVPLGEVYELAANFEGKTGNFVRNIEQALAKAKAENAGRDEEGGVRLSTYFRAKGLQWHTVILTGCNEGLIPHSKAPLEEERRLFYVAMTRAVANLLISYLKDAANNKVKPSRFISEAKLR